MFSSLFKFYYIFIISVLVLSIFFCLFIPPFFSGNSYEYFNLGSFSLNGLFLWPTPGYTTITSPFGNRDAPTSGASTFHSGIDIGAPTGINIISICSGTVTFLGFSGAGGFTITIENGNFSVFYCHVSPDYKVYVGEHVSCGQLIGNVGPQYVYGVVDNPYTDENGNPTNGATTGPHLHLTIRKNGNLVNPLDYLSN